MGELNGLPAIVTGGSSGIGAEVVRMLAERGAVVASFDLQPPKSPSSPGLTVDCDVRSTESVTAAVDQVVSQFGAVDILINNAGIGAQGTVADNTDEEWARLFDVNVIGIARMTRAALPHLRRSSAASIVNTSSVVANIGLPNRALYGATKGAVQSLTLAMAADHLPDGIRVNCVTPGTTDTPWVARLLDAAPDATAERHALASRQPLGRLISPLEVASAIVYLASPASNSTTGTSLPVDGGLSSLRLPR